MAHVFLSYDREDCAKAEAIAQALEKAGHSVWWDRHIKGGAEYGKEIEQALSEADAVVVLWSRQSVDSAWVRDEAAAGRDRRRLIPIRLDVTSPPMGFRQYQNIDLNDWKGRGKPPRLDEILNSIDSIGAQGLSHLDRPAAPATTRVSRRVPAALIVGLALAAIAIAALLVLRPWSANSLPLVSVEPADQSSSAKMLASDLFIKLGSLQSVEANALRLVEPRGDAQPDFTFKVGATAANAEWHANVVLVDGDGELLWSREFTQPGGNRADLRQQVAYSAGQVLRCATEALAPDHSPLDASVLSLYLKGCAELSATSDTRLSIPTFRTVTEKAPRFAGGWGKLLIAELEAFKAGGAHNRALQNDLRRHVTEARQVNPDLAESYLVQSWLQTPRPILGWMRLADEALAKNPDHAAILENHAIGLSHIGQMRDAVENARRAAQIEPLSPSIRQTLIVMLLDSGAYEAAQRELNEAERLWPGASNILQTRFLLEHRYGDPKKALDFIDSGRTEFFPAQRSFLRARIDRTSSSVERAIVDARKAYQEEGKLAHYIQALATFGRKDEAIESLLSTDPGIAPGVITVFFRVPFKGVRRDPRFMEIAHRYGLVEYWRASERWPDFCSEPDLPYDCRAEAARLS